MDPQETTGSNPSEATSTTTTTDTPETPSADDQAADADFAAGYNAAAQGESPTPPESRPTETATASTEGKPAESAKPGTSEPAKPAEREVIPGYTESALKAMLDKAASIDELKADLGRMRDTMAGRFGEFQQKLASITTSAAAGAPLTVTKDKLKKLGAEYEEIASLLADDLSDILKSPGVDAAAIEREVETRVATKLTEHDQKTQRALLTWAHRDWPKVWKSPDFQEWLGAVTPQVRSEVESSWDAMFLSDALNEFKAWQKNGKKAPGTTATPPSDTKDKRLKHAMTPDTQAGADRGGGLLSDEDAFADGFNKTFRSPTG